MSVKEYHLAPLDSVVSSFDYDAFVSSFDLMPLDKLINNSTKDKQGGFTQNYLLAFLIIILILTIYLWLNSFNWDKTLKYFRGLLPKKVKDQDREEIIGDLLELKESMREDKVHPIWINLCMFWQMLCIIASILVSIIQVSIKISR